MNRLITFYFRLLFVVILFSSNTFAQVSYTISTIAGDGSSDFKGDGGQALNAGFKLSLGTAIDAAGNIYITDDRRIRKIDATSGIITTIAGNGTSGSSGDGGDATLAVLNPLDIKVDASGNLYIVDETAHRVRKIDAATNIITTVAGTGVAGFSGDGGLATSAQLAGPVAIALDDNDNLYISDFDNRRIRKVDAATGIITTIAGNGTLGSTGDGGSALQAQLNLPWGIMVGNFGDLYIVDQGNFRIRKINLCDNTISTVAGNGNPLFNGDGGDATQANIFPWTLAQDNNGNIYFNENTRIRKLSPSSTSGYIRANQAQAIAGSTIKVPIRSQDLVAIAGIQFEMKFDPTQASFKGITDINPKLKDFSKSNYNGATVPGELNVVWLEPDLKMVSWQANEVLFNIELDISSTTTIGDKLSLDFSLVLAIDSFSNAIHPGGIPGCVSIVAASKITGKMKTPSNQTVTEVALSLTNKNGTTTTINTIQDGSYNITQLIPDTYTITPSKQGVVQNGVDVGDVIALHRHVLNKEELNTPYKVIAGDLDMSGQINLIDLFTARSIVLGKTTTLPKNWRFVPSNYTFNNSMNPLTESFPESITVQLTGNQINQDFIAIKIGDVNGSADPSLRVTTQPLVLATPAQQVFAKQTIQVPITTTTDYHSIAGLQGTLEFNSSVLKYKDITPVGLPLNTAQHFNLNKVDQGQLVFVYDHPQGEAESLQSGSVLFYINFEVIGAPGQTSSLRLTDQYTAAKAYQADLTPQSLQLNGGEIKITEPQVSVFPNPAKRFQVTFGITKDQSQVSFSLRNQQGQVISRQQGVYGQGQQQFNWQPNVAPGIYFLTIETSQYKTTKKVVIK